MAVPSIMSLGPPPPTFRKLVVEDAPPEIPSDLLEEPRDGDDGLLSPIASPRSWRESDGPPPFRLEVAGSAGLAGYPAMSPRSGMLKQKVDDHLFLNGDYELRPELHNGAPCWEKRPPDDEARAEGDNRRRALDEGDERRVLFRAADGRSWVIDTEAHDGNEDALVVARAWTGSADPTGIGRSWGPVPLCIHAAGVNCGSACLECAGAQEQGPSMANCC
ncbi:unnamed protein product [Prorocentrum cordatum]|uniref:Uncharacterized protein n=1 Tax=Prorocentrum cordatum TaxID=2364126 RepID=A0ABN9VVT6_9DINO|nr:unnamed protein product [Polarella glacialis]